MLKLLFVSSIECNNCVEHGYPCLNCAEYILNGTQGPGHFCHSRILVVEYTGEVVLRAMIEWMANNPDEEVFFAD